MNSVILQSAFDIFPIQKETLYFRKRRCLSTILLFTILVIDILKFCLLDLASPIIEILTYNLFSSKVFNCPANLASHRRWHKPREPGSAKRRRDPVPESGRYPCQRCGKVFRRQAYLRKHLLAHDQPDADEKEPSSAFRQVHSDYVYQTVRHLWYLLQFPSTLNIG